MPHEFDDVPPVLYVIESIGVFGHDFARRDIHAAGWELINGKEVIRQVGPVVLAGLHFIPGCRWNRH